MFIGTNSLTPLPSNLSLPRLQQLAKTAESQLDSVTTVQVNAQPNRAQPATATPDGYKLTHPGRNTGSVYNSDPVYQQDYVCTTRKGCTVLAEVKAQFRESIRGGSSKNWDLTYYFTPTGNPGAVSWYYTAAYSCGVNIKGGGEHTCGNGASASGVTDLASSGRIVTKTFEKVSGNVVFPMAALATHFDNSHLGGKAIVDTWKFRGCDVKNTASSTQLVAVEKSGTG